MQFSHFNLHTRGNISEKNEKKYFSRGADLIFKVILWTKNMRFKMFKGFAIGPSIR